MSEASRFNAQLLRAAGYRAVAKSVGAIVARMITFVIIE
jgi:hypothetical protein